MRSVDARDHLQHFVLHRHLEGIALMDWLNAYLQPNPTALTMDDVLQEMKREDEDDLDKVPVQSHILRLAVFTSHWFWHPEIEEDMRTGTIWDYL
jgi:hypothetical protein